MKVLKKDGRVQDFDVKKIVEALEKAQENIGDNSDLTNVKVQVYAQIYAMNKPMISTAEIDIVAVEALKENKYMNLAKAYKKNSERRRKERLKHTDLMQAIRKIGVETDRDNANVGNNFSSKLLRIASESNKAFMLSDLLGEELAYEHEVGNLYYHDLDSYNLTTNCLHLPTKELLEHGFNTGYGTIKPPKRIESAAELSCILLQSSQNDMFGGQSHPDFDNDMAVFVESTRQEIRKHLIELGIEQDKICKLTEKELNQRVHQAMQGIVYNLNTMHSRAGSQVPFSSINLGIPKSEEAALICKAFLEEYEKGLGKGEQPIFPNIIFRVKEGVNREPQDPYYYLFKLACRVAAKRMNPTFMNIDADFNKEYYDKGYMPATMGCTDGKEIVTYKIEDLLYVESFERMWDRLSKSYEIKGNTKTSLYMQVNNVYIFDTKEGFVKVKTIIKNSDKGDWTRVTFSNGRSLLATADHPLPIENKGRTFIKDAEIGDKVMINPSQYSKENYIEGTDEAWLFGVILCDGTYDSSLAVSIALDSEDDIERKYVEVAQNKFGYKVEAIERHRGAKGNYKDLIARGKTKETRKYLEQFYGGLQKANRQIPNVVFNWNIEARKAFLAGMIDADGYIDNTTHGGSVVQLGSTNKELALQTMALAQSIGYYAKLYLNKYNSKDIRYRVEFVPDKEFVDKYIVCGKKKNNYIERRTPAIRHIKSAITKIEVLGYLNKPSYDVETESDHFEVSGIYSHNCRTYLMKNVNGEPGCKGRGNIAPTTINLPRIGLEAKGDINKFFEIFDKRINMAKKSLLHRYDTLKKLKVKDLPFVAGQHLMKGSEGLSKDDSIEPILKQGTWGIGFIGLAETLVALTGKHHGEDENSRELGYRIIQHLRDKCDKFTEETHLNWSCYATPAEGLSGKFIKKDKILFGEIKGVTDKEYYTNSFHIPVNYPISMLDKIKIEAPFHKMCNGGHISYIEIDDYPDPELIEQLISYAYKNTNISYVGINFHIRYCKDCGERLTANDTKCPKCGGNNIQGISRVTGYLSLDERFTPGKVAERKDRTAHNSSMHEKFY